MSDLPLGSTYPIINPLNWGYNGTVKHVVGKSGTVKLVLKDSKNDIQLHQFVDENIPSLKNGANFKLNPLLFTGYLQTMYLAGANFSKSFPVFYGREVHDFSDGGIASIDWVMNQDWQSKYQLKTGKDNTLSFNKELFQKDAEMAHKKNWPRLHPRTRFLTDEEVEMVHGPPNSEKPLVVIMHGVAGGSHEPIIRSLAQDLAKIHNHRFQVCVLNARGCARSKISNRKLYSALHYEDLDELVKAAKRGNPKRKVYAVGFSFGAVQLANYLTFKGNKVSLDAAATICGPWDVVSSCNKLNYDFWSKRLFSKAITQFLTRLVKVNMEELEVPDDFIPEHEPTIDNPNFYTCSRTNLNKMKTATSTYDFDSVFTAPSYGFKTALDYYSFSSPIKRIEQIKIPTLVINSTDDPVIGTESIPISGVVNPNLMICETNLGGHLAYLDNNYESWVTRQVAEFFAKFDELLV